MELLSRAEAMRGELEEIWHRLHRCPELGNREFFTRDFIEKDLRSLGLETERVLDTGLVAALRGGRPGPTVALRADMDALPITEDTGAAFASQNSGCMHACGHDFHITAALGCARLLAERREALPGTVRFLFQPDEEGNGGAQRLIAAGALRGAEAIFGAHVSPDLPAGTVGIRYGKFYAASDMFTVTVHGRSCHAAVPEKGVDALSAAAEMVGALRKRRGELQKAYGPTVISVGMLHAGTAGNIIADTAAFSGILRTLGPEARAETRRSFSEEIEAAAERFGARAEIALRESYPGVVNEERATAHAERCARELLGTERVVRIEAPTMTTEDFGCYLQEIPGSFYHIGVGGAEPLHSSRFLPDPGALPVAAALHAHVLTEFLRKREIRPERCENSKIVH